MSSLDPLQFLPHKPPFVFVDRIVELQPSQRAVGVKNVSANEWYLQGHFPNNPLMPGVILAEALAQVAGVALNSGANPSEKRTFLASIRAMKFKRAVIPGEQLTLIAEKNSQLGELTQFSVSAKVGDEVVAEGELVLGWVA
jgi:3-hydroxyacyl-[acyl-carrier-protein] dehydratase